MRGVVYKTVVGVYLVFIQLSVEYKVVALKSVFESNYILKFKKKIIVQFHMYLSLYIIKKYILYI